MGIKVNTYQLQGKATYAASIASELKEKVEQINNIYYSLDSEVKGRLGIGGSIQSLHMRIEKAEWKMYNISSFLKKAAERYERAETAVVAKGKSLWSVGAANVGTATVGTGESKEKKKWYQSNWFKLAVGAVVVGAAVALAVTVGGPILIAMAVGAAIGAGVGAVTGGVVSKMNGGSFWDGAADGFMWGAVGGAASGAIGATGLGILGAAGAEGAINAGVYVGQTLQNGGDVTVAGVATSFAIGAGMSAIGTVVSNKISSVVSKHVKYWDDVDFSTIDDAGVKNLIGDINKSSLTSEEKVIANIEVYNKAVDSGIKTDVQVIADPKFVDSSTGKVKWPKAEGYVVDDAGNAIKTELVPKVGDTIDRYGSSYGTYTSPVTDGKSFSFDQRSLPYIENPNAYHKYEVIRTFSELKETILNWPDKELLDELFMDAKAYGFDIDTFTTFAGEIAPAFDATGGGVQWNLPISIEYLEEFGFIREIK